MKRTLCLFFLLALTTSCSLFSEEEVLVDSQKPLENAVDTSTIQMKDPYYLSLHEAGTLHVSEDALKPTQGELFAQLNDQLDVGSIWGKVWIGQGMHMLKFSRFYGTTPDMEGGIRKGGQVTLDGVGTFDVKVAAFGTSHLILDKTLLGTYEAVFFVDTSNTAHLHFSSRAEQVLDKYYLRFQDVDLADSGF